MTARPTNLTLLSPGRLKISWSDGQDREYSVRALRDRCPCATCREKRQAPPAPTGGLSLLAPADLAPVSLAGMRPVGNYAYALQFSDGHDTGIYTLELLHELGEPAS